MKIGFFKFLLFSLILVVGGCNSDDPIVNDCQVTIDFDGSSIRYCPSEENSTVGLNREQDEFIWQAMNLYYYWQDEVGDLADDRFGSYNELYGFLNNAESSEDLFEIDLLSPNDRFSWIVDDYIALENSFQGISTSFGYELGFIRVSVGNENILAYVAYVVKEGPADLAGLKRGDLINKVDGTTLTNDNYVNLLFRQDSYTVSLAKIEEDAVVSLDESINLVKVELAENPILVNNIIDLSGLKVGYLSYNQFVNNNDTHRELNNVFGQFKSEGINELVLDLRYNPGGSVSTTSYLASMIYGNATSDDELGTIVWNEKLSDYNNRAIRFIETLPIVNESGSVTQEVLNRLEDITRLFVLTSSKSASASELLIVGLDPYIDVITIGTTTTGKNEGSVTLYDSKKSLYTRNDTDDLNPNHKYAIQPIVLKLANSEGFSDYSDGLEPIVEIDERNFLADLKQLGDVDEPLLAEALAIMQGTARRVKPEMIGEIVDFKSDKRKLLEKSIIDPEYLPDLNLDN